MATLTLRWIDRASVDLPLFIGAAVFGWAALVAHVVFHVPALSLYWVWILFLDGPHLFATWTRTYLDPEERRARRALLWGALAWAVVPVAAIAWGLATGGRLPYFVFVTVAQVWAYWHVVRQHYGFMVLYQRKAGEPAGADNRVDAAAFYALMMAPFVSFAIRHPEARRELGLPFVLSPVERGFCALLLVVTLAAVVGYAGKEALRVKRGAPWNAAKNLFLASCVPLHVTALLHPTWSMAMELAALPVIVTAYHNVQYSGIVWSYAQKRYGAGPAGAGHGLAGRITRRVTVWYALGVAITVLCRYASWALDGRFAPFTRTSFRLGGAFSATEIVNAWWWFVAIHHYYLDQKIWRVSRDRAVQRGLGLAEAQV